MTMCIDRPVLPEINDVEEANYVPDPKAATHVYRLELTPDGHVDFYQGGEWRCTSAVQFAASTLRYLEKVGPLP